MNKKSNKKRNKKMNKKRNKKRNKERNKKKNNKFLENELDFLPIAIIKIIKYYKDLFETCEKYNKSIKLMKKYNCNEKYPSSSFVYHNLCNIQTNFILYEAVIIYQTVYINRFLNCINKPNKNIKRVGYNKELWFIDCDVKIYCPCCEKKLDKIFEKFKGCTPLITYNSSLLCNCYDDRFI